MTRGGTAQLVSSARSTFQHSINFLKPSARDAKVGMLDTQESKSFSIFFFLGVDHSASLEGSRRDYRAHTERRTVESQC